MKALVTGAGGFVGPHLVEHLLQRGDEVVALDLGSGPDLRDHRGWIDRIADEGPEVVYHLAGLSDVAGSWNDPRATYEINVLGTVAVLEASRLASGPRVIVISSAEVYGLVAPDEVPIDEGRAPHPASPYGGSKLAAEAIALQYHRGHGLETIVVRPFNHIGPGQSTRFAAPAFADQVAAAEAEAELAGQSDPVVRHGDLSPERDLTDVRDVVRAYRLLAERGRPGETYNVCSGRSVPMASVLDTLLASSRTPIATEVDPGRLRPVQLPILRGSFRRLEEATGWRPTIDLATSLNDVLDEARRRHGVGLRAGGRSIG